MQLVDDDRVIEDVDAKAAESFDTSLEELIRRARLQASELSLMIQRLERLRRDVRRHLDPFSR